MPTKPPQSRAGRARVLVGRDRALVSSGARIWAVIAICAVLTASVPALPGAAGVVPEYELKAAFLYQFLKFAEWPPSGHDSSLRVLVAGPDAVERALRSSLRGKTVRNRTIGVERLTKTEQAPACDLLFVAGLERQEAMKLIEQFRGQPVLTVGESRAFLDAGGMIELRVVDQRVRIRINLDATEHAGLRLSPSLLTVADAVSRKQAGKPEANK